MLARLESLAGLLFIAISAGYFAIQLWRWVAGTDACVDFRAWLRRRVAFLRREFAHRTSVADLATDIERTWH